MYVAVAIIMLVFVGVAFITAKPIDTAKQRCDNFTHMIDNLAQSMDACKADMSCELKVDDYQALEILSDQYEEYCGREYVDQ